ncbi:valine--tRNA ligase [Prevotella dentalis DSM 3688]|uniref:Valine--tRNA ligase n=1 Tax=Prevotella dentalis (strain ATCC 49559 / DSM 3688 / JCM 13448 / NCTC 12043 / ES 2772) TaxID=908937 RepID=F9CZR1_PREDD|nr:valine--tRNA ligase [Prevotella dentalis DSM 3688]
MFGKNIKKRKAFAVIGNYQSLLDNGPVTGICYLCPAIQKYASNQWLKNIIGHKDWCRRRDIIDINTIYY